MMRNTADTFERGNTALPPECRASAELIQRALDGEAVSFTTDQHAVHCTECRERFAAARVLLERMPVLNRGDAPRNFVDRVLRALDEDRASLLRRKRIRTSAALVLAASILLALFFLVQSPDKRPDLKPDQQETASHVELAPAPREKPQAELPLRIGDEMSKAGQSLLETPRPIAEAMAIAPRLIEAIASPFKEPAAPNAAAGGIEPTWKFFVELPDVALNGLQPVANTAEKAFLRLLRDVAAVKPNS